MGASQRQADVAKAMRITVKDRGLGIAAEDRKHIFEPFYRGREAVSRQIQGSGLGLHLVRRIVEAHGGSVSVQSEPARQHLHDRLASRPKCSCDGVCRAAHRRAPLTAREARPTTLAAARLLLVEDEPGLQLPQRSSDRRRLSVETAGDGDRRARATGEPFDLIILDVMLPKRDGFDVARTVSGTGRPHAI